MRLLKMISSLIYRARRYIMGPIKYARSIGVKVGNDCSIFSVEFGSEPYLIEIGDHTLIGYNVSFITHDGGVFIFRGEDPSFNVYGKIKIGSNTFIGHNTTILPGVTIGDNCVIGASSIVTKSIPDGVVVAGSPCRYICSSEEYYKRMKPLNMKTCGMLKKQQRSIILNKPESLFIKRGYLST